MTQIIIGIILIIIGVDSIFTGIKLEKTTSLIKITVDKNTMRYDYGKGIWVEFKCEKVDGKKIKWGMTSHDSNGFTVTSQ